MHTLASFIFTSLDGFYEGPNGELDWPIVDQEFNDFAAYWSTEQAKANDPAMTSRMNSKEKIVFSTTLTDVTWSGTTLIRSEATEHIPTVFAGGREELLVIGTAHLTANLAQAGFLDELRIMVCPIVLGQGRSLFEDLKSRVSLSLIRVRRFDSGNLVLTYRPAPQDPSTGFPTGGEC